MADNNQQFQVTTSLISMFDVNSTQLRLSGMDSGLSVAIWEPEIDPSGKLSFPANKRHSIILNAETVQALSLTIKNNILPKWEAGENFKCGIPTNRNCSNVIDFLGKDGKIYFRMHKNVNADRIPERTLLFEFSDTTIMTNYNPQTGEYDAETIPTQFAFFCEVINAYNMVGQVAGHSGRVAMKFTIGSFYSYLQAIAGKLGAVVQTGYQRGAPRQNGGGNQQAEYNGQMNEVDSISALLS
ncbi:MAG: hypothetical protein NC548_05410 [Lachnospiraceae bacterium]|nr:hypothetical protein [Lachnospiraceae bacterium]